MTVAPAYSTIRPIFSTPYITAAEYKQAPTGINVEQLVKGDPAASLAELNNTIARASSWIDNYCGQILSATVDTDAARLPVDRLGAIHVHPRQTPICAVQAFSYGTSPNSLVALSDLSNLWVEAHEFHIPLTQGVTSWQGPLQFGSPRPGGWVYAQWTVVSGYPNTTLAATATTGATSLQVADATGVVAGRTQLALYDGGQTENVQVASSWTSGTTLPLVSPLQFPHAQTGVSVSALPPSIKQAGILLTTALIRTRGAAAIVAPSAGQLRASLSKASGADEQVLADIDLAMDLLEAHRRVR